MTQKHTRGPWKITEPPYAPHQDKFVYGPDDYLIADCSRIPRRSDREQKNNAKFITHACNCHDDLLAALKETKRAIEFIPKGIGRGAMAPLYQQVCAAIAKAETP